MTTNIRFSHRIISVLLCAAMLLSVLPFSAVSILGAGGDGFVRTVDPSTMNNWTDYFYRSADDFDTANAGGIVMDKSVLVSAAELDTMGITGVADPGTNGFLAVLSAIGSNMTITGESAVATDTVMVLDTSGSMGSAAVSAMVEAANISIKNLMDANPKNRIGVVFYANSTTTFLELDHYTTGNDDIYLTASSGGGTIYLDADVLDSSGGHPDVSSRSVTGGTYMSRGLHQALQTFENAAAPADDTPRKPVIMFMTDGSPTRSDTDYTNPPASGSNDLGNGTSTNERIVFATELAASYVKEKVTEKYQKAYGASGKCLFYTLGMTGGDNSPYRECVLDPVNKNTSAVVGFWDAYKTAAPGGEIVIQEGRREDTVVTKLGANDVTLSEKYVDMYLAAASEADLVEAFKQALADISLQTQYYPTLVEGGDATHSGYISFVDKIGRYMEVTKINGLVIGNVLYSGSHWAKALFDSAFGSVQAPTDLGDNLVWSIGQRLDIDVTTVRSLIDSAYAAGQMYYNSDTDFSNYFGWYSDADNKFLGFYSEGSTVPTGAVYTNKSYLFLGEYDALTDTYDSDMMYATVRIREKINTGEHEVDFAVPAALVPAVTYNVKLDASGVPEEITTNAASVSPIRLVYTTALDSRINKWTAGEIVDDAYINPPSNQNFTFTDGTINFFNNKWDFDGQTGYGTYNTYSYFRPSYENNRHYYQEDVVLHVADATSASGYKQYEGTKPVAGDGNTYFYGATVYAKTGASTYEKKIIFEQLRPEVLNGVTENTPSGWRIPAGYVRRAYADYHLPKTENETATLAAAAAPYTEYTEGLPNSADAGHESLVGATLGNNGKLSLTPEVGVKIVKQMAAGTAADPNKEFTFTVVSSNKTAATREVYKLDANGQEIPAEALAFDATGTATVKLKAGETLYIGDMAAGETVTVTENFETEYALQSLTVDGVADADGIAQVTLGAVDMPETVFTNAARGAGNLDITKIITHPYGTDYTIPEGITFTVNLAMLLDGQPLADYTFPDGFFTDGSGVLTVTIGHNESKLITGIPAGTVVTVAEDPTGMDGFTPTYYETNGTAHDGILTILENATATVGIINDYVPKPNHISGAGIQVSGIKRFDQNGNERLWTVGDTFTFQLQEYTTDWVTMDTQTITVTEGDGYEGTTKDYPFDFTDVFANKAYSAPGTYYYRVIEQAGNLPGVNYDITMHRFAVTVSDTDMGGKLQVSKVEALEGKVDVSGTYKVTATFVNDYDPSDAVVNVEIHKSVKNPTNSPNVTLSGFQFQIAPVNAFTDAVDWSTIEPTGKTSETGVIKFPLTLNQVGTFRYKVREVIPAQVPAGWIYTEIVQDIVVEVSDPDSKGLVAKAYLAGETNTDGATSTVVVPFENTYDLTDATVTADFVDKVLNGRDMAKDEFQFVIFDVDNNTEYTTGSHGASPDGVAVKVNFAENLTFKQVGEYHFTVYEKTDVAKPGVTFDREVYYITVAVTDNGNGALASELTVNDGVNDHNTVTFVNTYDAEDVPASVVGKKVLTGRKLMPNDFSFYMQECDAAGEVNTNKERYHVYNDENGNITFPEMIYNKPGTTHYLVWENIPTGDPMGIGYDQAKFIATVAVSDDVSEGKLKANVTYQTMPAGATAWSGTSAIIFNNTYSAENAAIVFDGSKTVENKDLGAGQYSFQLFKSNEAWGEVELLDTKTNGAADSENTGYFTFKSIPLNTVGVHRFLVKELIPVSGEGIKGVTYDETVYHITVNVKDNQRGYLVYDPPVITTANGTPVDNMYFINSYAPVEGTSVTVDGMKTLQTGLGTDVSFTDFTFTFEAYESDSSFTSVVGSKEYTDAAADGKFSFTFNYAPEDLGKTFYYVIKEKDNGIGGMTYSDGEYHVTVNVTDEDKDGKVEAAATITDQEGILVTGDTVDFVNTYNIIQTTSFDIGGTKKLEGRDILSNEFKFDLYTSDGQTTTGTGPVKFVYCGTDGVISITDIPLTTAGTHYFILKEDSSASIAKPGVLYDTTEYLITVEVTDNKDGTLSAGTPKLERIAAPSNVAATELLFKNEYNADASDPLNITGEKKLNGREMIPGEFTFVLQETDSQFVPKEGKLPMTAVNKEDKTFEFGALTYETIGTYYYVIFEDASVNVSRVDFDDAKYYVTVTVTDDPSTGKLKAECVIKDAPDAATEADVVFTNTFTPKPDDIYVDIDIVKTVDNKGTESIKPKDFDFILALEGADQPAKVTTDANGKAQFVLKFGEEDIGETYRYKLSEVKGNRDHVTYSTVVYDIAITISLGDDNKLVASITKDTVQVDSVVAEFVNEYDYTPKVPDVPKFGDDTHLHLGFALLFTSALAVVGLCTYGRKKEENA